MREEKLASWFGIIGNTLLFISKLIVGMMYNSVAIISDALNSFTDIIASAIVHISLLVSYRKEDKEHQFGHTRAQPIAALVVAIFTGIVGFEVIIASVKRIIFGGEIEQGIIPVYLVLIVLLVKLALYLYTKSVCNRTKSTALRASQLDHLNDILISFAVLIGVVLANFGYSVFDPIVGVLIGLYIIKAGFDIGMENTRYLMGEAPSDDHFKKISRVAKRVEGVIGLNDIRAHYVGTKVDCEVHIYVSSKMNVVKAHNIGKKVRIAVEGLEFVSHAFIHIDPFKGKFKSEMRF